MNKMVYALSFWYLFFRSKICFWITLCISQYMLYFNYFNCTVLKLNPYWALRLFPLANAKTKDTKYVARIANKCVWSKRLNKILNKTVHRNTYKPNLSGNCVGMMRTMRTMFKNSKNWQWWRLSIAFPWIKHICAIVYVWLLCWTCFEKFQAFSQTAKINSKIKQNRFYLYFQ